MPILLSIGYSSCHWCHVMERESFEDGETAEFMNEHFVPVKVDREERPDVDAIYMEAVQGMTGQGGWPLTAFCDPDGVPFYGGTYFPPEPRHGMPSFTMLMEAVAESWGSQRERIRGSAENISAQLQAVGRIEPSEEAVTQDGLDGSGPPAADGGRHGERRLRRGAQVPARLGDRAAAGARRDGGSRLARSTRWPRAASTTRWAADSRATPWTRVWLVPHFEKMLYDNALLARAYLHGFQALGHERWRTRVRANARLGAPRDARAGGRLLLRPGRRLRGRGGALLRVVALRARGGAGRGRARGRGGSDHRALGRDRRAGTSRAATSCTCPRAPTPTSRPASNGPGRSSTSSGQSACGPASTTSAFSPGTR